MINNSSGAASSGNNNNSAAARALLSAAAVSSFRSPGNASASNNPSNSTVNGSFAFGDNRSSNSSFGNGASDSAKSLRRRNLRHGGGKDLGTASRSAFSGKGSRVKRRVPLPEDLLPPVQHTAAPTRRRDEPATTFAPKATPRSDAVITVINDREIESSIGGPLSAVRGVIADAKNKSRDYVAGLRPIVVSNSNFTNPNQDVSAFISGTSLVLKNTMLDNSKKYYTGAMDVDIKDGSIVPDLHVLKSSNDYGVNCAVSGNASVGRIIVENQPPALNVDVENATVGEVYLGDSLSEKSTVIVSSNASVGLISSGSVGNMFFVELRGSSDTRINNVFSENVMIRDSDGLHIESRGNTHFSNLKLYDSSDISFGKNGIKFSGEVELASVDNSSLLFYNSLDSFVAKDVVGGNVSVVPDGGSMRAFVSERSSVSSVGGAPVSTEVAFITEPLNHQLGLPKMALNVSGVAAAKQSQSGVSNVSSVGQGVVSVDKSVDMILGKSAVLAVEPRNVDVNVSDPSVNLRLGFLFGADFTEVQNCSVNANVRSLVLERKGDFEVLEKLVRGGAKGGLNLTTDTVMLTKSASDYIPEIVEQLNVKSFVVSSPSSSKELSVDNIGDSVSNLFLESEGATFVIDEKRVYNVLAISGSNVEAAGANFTEEGEPVKANLLYLAASGADGSFPGEKTGVSFEALSNESIAVLKPRHPSSFVYDGFSGNLSHVSSGFKNFLVLPTPIPFANGVPVAFLPGSLLESSPENLCVSSHLPGGNGGAIVLADGGHIENLCLAGRSRFVVDSYGSKKTTIERLFVEPGADISLLSGVSVGAIYQLPGTPAQISLGQISGDIPAVYQLSEGDRDVFKNLFSTRDAALVLQGGEPFFEEPLKMFNSFDELNQIGDIISGKVVLTPSASLGKVQPNVPTDGVDVDFASLGGGSANLVADYEGINSGLSGIDLGGGNQTYGANRSHAGVNGANDFGIHGHSSALVDYDHDNDFAPHGDNASLSDLGHNGNFSSDFDNAVHAGSKSDSSLKLAGAIGVFLGGLALSGGLAFGAKKVLDARNRRRRRDDAGEGFEMEEVALPAVRDVESGGVEDEVSPFVAPGNEFGIQADSLEEDFEANLGGGAYQKFSSYDDLPDHENYENHGGVRNSANYKSKGVLDGDFGKFDRSLYTEGAAAKKESSDFIELGSDRSFASRADYSDEASEVGRGYASRKGFEKRRSKQLGSRVVSFDTAGSSKSTGFAGKYASGRSVVHKDGRGAGARGSSSGGHSFV